MHFLLNHKLVEECVRRGKPELAEMYRKRTFNLTHAPMELRRKVDMWRERQFNVVRATRIFGSAPSQYAITPSHIGNSTKQVDSRVPTYLDAVYHDQGDFSIWYRPSDGKVIVTFVPIGSDISNLPTDETVSIL